MQTLLTISTAAIALIVAIITYHQFHTDRLRLRRELFDLRFAVFKDAQRYLTQIMREAKFPEGDYGEYVDACQRSKFLFPDEISVYLEEIRDKSVMLGVGNKKNRDNAHDNLVWLTSQTPILFDKFRPYMKFDI